MFSRMTRAEPRMDLDSEICWIRTVLQYEQNEPCDGKLTRINRIRHLDDRRCTPYTINAKISNFGCPEILLSLGSVLYEKSTKIEIVTKEVEEDLEDVSEEDGMAGLGALFG